MPRSYRPLQQPNAPITVRLPLPLRDQLEKAAARAGVWSRSDVHRAALVLGIGAIAASDQPAYAVMALLHNWTTAAAATAAATAALSPAHTPTQVEPS